jgi:hypothetical protein
MLKTDVYVYIIHSKKSHAHGTQYALILIPVTITYFNSKPL